jgi:nucleotide-binding universal stress UspA family protein
MTPICKSVVCAVDNSDAGAVAARLAARITSPEGVLTLVSVDDRSVTAWGMFPMMAVVGHGEPRAEHALQFGRDEAEPLHGLWTRRLTGLPVTAILDEAEQRRATLLVIGSHGYSRRTGIAFGLVGSHLLRQAPCSVLVAHSERCPQRWPRSIVVGVDGSLESAAAADAARDLAARFQTSLRLVACARGHLDLEAACAIGPEVEVLPSRPVDALRALSKASDLVVVGSRGLKGLHALGSVSERVAHGSDCSVLIVRPPSAATH